MKKKKLNLDELEVQSFVTAFDKANGETVAIKGGYYTQGCPTADCGGEPSVPQHHCGPGGGGESLAQCGYTAWCGYTLDGECQTVLGKPNCGN